MNNVANAQTNYKKNYEWLNEGTFKNVSMFEIDLNVNRINSKNLFQ